MLGAVAEPRKTLSPALAEALEHLVSEAWELLDADDEARARATIAEATALAPAAADVLALQAELALRRNDLATAEGHLRAAIADDPEHADALHTLGRLLEEREDIAEMIELNLRVHALDTRADRRAGIGTPDDLAFIEDEARRTLDTLPPHIAERVEDVPIVLEARPSVDLVREGFDPRALGLFEGPTDFARKAGHADTRPTRIVLFYANLLVATPDDDELAEQVEITILHEIGHFFGLDEDDVADLGLE
jgi:predicted Zn-dependent protease with MMP-like domain